MVESLSTARIPDGTPLGLVQVGLAGTSHPTPGRSDPPVKPTSEVAHQPGQQPAASIWCPCCCLTVPAFRCGECSAWACKSCLCCYACADSQCEAINPRTDLPCLLADGHEGPHRDETWMVVDDD